VSEASSELNRIALDYLRRLRAEGLKGAKVEVLKPYDKRTDNAGTSMKNWNTGGWSISISTCEIDG